MALVLVEGEDHLPALLDSTNMTRLGNLTDIPSTSPGTTAPTSSAVYRRSPGSFLYEAASIIALIAFLV
jgi:hypothetical protein